MQRILEGGALSLCGLLCLVPSGHAAGPYFVDRDHPAAADSNDGSEAHPWRTIQQGASTALAGETVFIKNGTYNEVVTAQRSGTAGSPITFAAYPGHKPVLDGTGLGGWFGIFTIRGQDFVTVRGLEIRNNATGWGVLVEHQSLSNPATGIELSDLEVHHTGGESIQIRGNVSEVQIRNSVVHDAVSRSGIDIYLWDGGRPHHVTVSGCTAYNFPGFAGIASEQADNLLIENNTVHDSSLGIDIGSGDANVIRNNVVRDCGTGIALSSNEDSLVHDNLIENITEEALYAYYWILHGEAHARNKWFRNTVRNAGCGIYESNRKDSRYGTGPSVGHEYFNNVFIDVGNNYRAALYFRGTTGLRFYDNTAVINAGFPALDLQLGSTGADVRNTILSTSAAAAVTVDTASASGTVVDYNCYFNRSGVSTGPGAHSVLGNPLFTSSSDLHLQADSPCLDRGTDLSAHHTTDRDGIARPQGAGWDIGAYERPSATARITIDDVAAIEGDQGTKEVVITVRLDGPTKVSP